MIAISAGASERVRTEWNGVRIGKERVGVPSRDNSLLMAKKSTSSYGHVNCSSGPTSSYLPLTTPGFSLRSLI